MYLSWYLEKRLVFGCNHLFFWTFQVAVAAGFEVVVLQILLT